MDFFFCLRSREDPLDTSSRPRQYIKYCSHGSAPRIASKYDSRRVVFIQPDGDHLPRNSAYPFELGTTPLTPPVSASSSIHMSRSESCSLHSSAGLTAHSPCQPRRSAQQVLPSPYSRTPRPQSSSRHSTPGDSATSRIACCLPTH